MFTYKTKISTSKTHNNTATTNNLTYYTEHNNKLHKDKIHNESRIRLEWRNLQRYTKPRNIVLDLTFWNSSAEITTT